MDTRRTFFIVDDDQSIVEILSRFLEGEGHRVFSSTSSTEALRRIVEIKPDGAVLDIMMPGMDGLELLKKLRAEPELAGLRIVMVSAKSFAFDRNRAFAFGADGFITKPVDGRRFTETLRTVMADRMELGFWGVHGTLPVPGEQTVKYGGNTPCVSLGLPRGDLFIFDAGTGIKLLSNHLRGQDAMLVGTKIFISHPHWDHINALPFFEPLYKQGNEIEICGPSHGDTSMRELISGQMDGVYFPINIKEFSAQVSFRDLSEEVFRIHNVTVTTLLLNHPGNCLGYRVAYKDRSVCYVTDNELSPRHSPHFNAHYAEKLREFVAGTDALIMDCTYKDEEYERMAGRGHSALYPVVDLADRAKVKTLYLFHHDPDHTDADIDDMVKTAHAMLRGRRSSTQCVAPREKQRVLI